MVWPQSGEQVMSHDDYMAMRLNRPEGAPRVDFFFQAEDGIRDGHVTGVQTCALPISARISPGDQPRRPVGDDEQRVGLALDAMGRRLRSPRLPGVDVPAPSAPAMRRCPRALSPGARCDGPTSTSACWPTVLPSGIVALRGRLTHGPRSPAARRADPTDDPPRSYAAVDGLRTDHNVEVISRGRKTSDCLGTASKWTVADHPLDCVMRQAGLKRLKDRMRYP